jgi:hypothetical protein
MRGSKVKARVGRIVSAGALVIGIVTVVSHTAWAAGPFFVTPVTNSFTENLCTGLDWKEACTITRALALESGSSAGTQIWMKHGIYSGPTNSVINMSDLAAGNNGVVIIGGYKGVVGVSPLPMGSTTLKPGASGLQGGNAIVDFSANSGITVKGQGLNHRIIVDSLGLVPPYVAGQAPVLNSGGTGDVLGPLVKVTLGSPKIAVDVTAGSTTVTDDLVATAAYSADGIVCATAAGCTVTGSKVTGTGTTAGILVSCVTSPGLVTISGNTVSGNTASPPSASALGAGIVLSGAQGETVSANVSHGNTIGLLLDTCSGVGSTGNSITGNTIGSTNSLFGVVITGATADPVDVGVSIVAGVVQVASEPNTFTNNNWHNAGPHFEANVVDLNAFHGQVTPACSGVTVAAPSLPPATVIGPGSISVTTSTTCTLQAGTNLEDASDPGHINQELYVSSSVALIGGGPAAPVAVDNFIPTQSGTEDEAPNAGLVAGDTLLTDQDPAANASSASNNTYTGNAPADPTTNGSASLDNITGSGGYLSD